MKGNCPFRPPNPVMETLLSASQVIKILKVLKEVLNAYSKQDQSLLINWKINGCSEINSHYNNFGQIISGIMNGKAKKNTGGLSVTAAAENLSRKMTLLEGSQSLLAPSLTKKKIKKRPQPLAHSTPIPGASQQLLEAPPPKRPMQKYSAHSQPKAGTSQQLQEAPPPKRPKINLTAPRSTPVSVVKKIKKPATALTNIALQRRSMTQLDTISQLGASSSTIKLTEKINSLNRRIINVEETNTTINNRLTSLANWVKSLDDSTKRMEEMQESMLKMLKDMTKRNSPEARRRPACFPFKSIADLLEFDNSNEELYDDVVNYLAYLGGANLCDEANFYFKNCFEFDADLFRNLWCL
ncbi:uncharacterized protein LOC100679502 isoform X10 [Nasonia vitripennis]|uniref:Uncharacterized protein n=1 Tax=Nasonia vitripennis TaxID=7425 RepID=A0A7M7Q742_NASVI|nr:uncharacterized protein LOC100679502 isoform X10 [Nasonia vitripennis]